MKIDLRLLSAVLNPAIAVILIGGLILKLDVVLLIAIGVVGYSVWGVINIMAHKQAKREEEEKRQKKKKRKKTA